MGWTAEPKKLLDLVSKNVKSINLQHGNDIFKSLDDLSYYKEGSAIINEIGNVILNGIPLGNG